LKYYVRDIIAATTHISVENDDTRVDNTQEWENETILRWVKNYQKTTTTSIQRQACYKQCFTQIRSTFLRVDCITWKNQSNIIYREIQSERKTQGDATIHIDHKHKVNDTQTTKQSLVIEKTRFLKTRANITIIVIRD
jgi:hypothetical protein